MYFCLILSISLVLCRGLASILETSAVDMHDPKMLSTTDQSHSDSVIERSNLPNVDLVMNMKNPTQDETVESPYEKRSRNNRSNKEKHGKLIRQKIRTNKSDIGRIHRNDEKDILVRNRTIEILKNGFKILSANSERSFGGNMTFSHVNETLLEKILSSGASKPDLLISGMYKLSIGGNMYENEGAVKVKSNDSKIRSYFPDGKNVSQENAYIFGDLNGRSSHDHRVDYEYDYDEIKDSNNRNDITKPYALNSDYDTVGVDSNIKNVLEQIITRLKTFSEFKVDVDRQSPPKDPCAKWLECKNHLAKAFIGQNILPSCPCHYPSTIFYNDAIWDQNQKRFFRWRDASNEAERLDIYKPGAVYCIRSLLAQSGASISSQQCCYDGNLRLLTRGSGAGTINFVSPDVSKELHDTVDVLPWRLCKGDFTRYNLARQPDNGNRCPTNPNDDVYELQVKLSKYF